MSCIRILKNNTVQRVGALPGTCILLFKMNILIYHGLLVTNVRYYLFIYFSFLNYCTGLKWVIIVFAGSCLKIFRRLWRLRWTTRWQQRPMTIQSTTTGQRYDCQCTHNFPTFYFIFFSVPGVFYLCFTHLQINDWVISISSANADLISRQVIGNTYEGRPMHLLKVNPYLCQSLNKTLYTLVIKTYS